MLTITPSRPRRILLLLLPFLATVSIGLADEPPTEKWTYRPELLRPFWEGTQVEGESVLFIRDEAIGEARAKVLFPITKVIRVTNSAGDAEYEEGRDYRWIPDSREIVLPVGSRIVSSSPEDLRRPAGTQRFALTHRDGNGEILFGARLEYAEMQTCITYEHAAAKWPGRLPKYDPQQLPRTTGLLAKREPLSIVVLGDSISTGLNSSKVGTAAPFQPGYDELLAEHLRNVTGSEVNLTNLSVGGKDSAWGKTQVPAVVASKPDLVILAFGMNDAAGRPAAEFQTHIRETLQAIQTERPGTEFILIATMRGNPDWIRLNAALFAEYRDALQELCEPGIALADLTSVWDVFLERKKDWDQTGNGVNHPNDFGHRVYAQVISRLLIPSATE